MTPTSNCRHTVTQGREGEVGSWCIDCGAKVWEVDDRECQHCANAQKLIGGWICRRYLMAITPNMHVTFRIVDGSCWQSAPSASAQQAEPIYQLQRADGSWIDQAEHSYKYNLSHGHAVRIVYAAPAPASPAALTDGCTEENCQRCRTPQELRTPNLRHAGIGSYPADQDEPSASPDALTDEQINEAFDSFCRNMSLVSVLYREDAQKFARTLLARSRARITADTGDSEADSLIDRLMSLSPTFTECERAAGYIRRAALAASPDALTDERVFELVGEVLGQPLIVEDLRQGFAVHAEPRDWLNFARALLAMSATPPAAE